MSHDLESRLTSLIDEAGQRHHAAFAESDGADPEWALWYAGYLQSHLWDASGRIPTRSELTYLLIGAERAYKEAGSDEPWQRFYGRHLLASLAQPIDP